MLYMRIHNLQTLNITLSLQDNLPTNQLAVSEVADWSTHRTSQLADANFINIMEILHCTCTLNITMTLTLSNIDSVQIVLSTRNRT